MNVNVIRKMFSLIIHTLYAGYMYLHGRMNRKKKPKTKAITPHPTPQNTPPKQNNEKKQKAKGPQNLLLFKLKKSKLTTLFILQNHYK